MGVGDQFSKINELLFKSVKIVRTIQCLLIGAMLVLLGGGFGFRLMQRWEARVTGTGDQYLMLCSVKGFETMSKQSECGVEGLDESVYRLGGYRGAMPIGLWGTFGLEGQFFCFIVCILAFLITIVMLLVALNVIKLDIAAKKVPILGTLAVLGLCMLIVMGLNFWYAGCGPYSNKTYELFREKAKKEKEKIEKDNQITKLQLVFDEEEDFVVSCHVYGYVGVALFALASAVLFFVDVKLTNKLCNPSMGAPSAPPVGSVSASLPM